MNYAYQCLFLKKGSILFSFSKGTGVCEEITDRELKVTLYKDWNPTEMTGEILYLWNDTQNPKKFVDCLFENYKLLPSMDDSSVIKSFKYAMSILEKVKSDVTVKLTAAVEDFYINHIANSVRTFNDKYFFQPYPDMPLDCYVYEDRLVVIRKEFAEKYLTKEALELATQFDDDYAWTWEHFHAVLYEIPSVFKVDFMDIMKNFTLYLGEYIKKSGLGPDTLLPRFEENEEKSLNIKCRLDLE